MFKYLIVRSLLFLCCLVLPSLLSAETILQGIVTYQNTGQPMGFVQVSARGSSPVVTKQSGADQGVFKLRFPNAKPDAVVILKIEGQNLEVVNREALRQRLPASLNDEPVRIVVCKVGERNQKAIEYFEISTAFIEKNYQKEIGKREKQIEQFKKQLAESDRDKIGLSKLISDLENQKSQLQRRLQNLEDDAWLMAQEFSNIDLAQESALYNKAFKLFQQGEIEAARAVLNGKERKAGRQKILTRQKELDMRKANLDKKKADVERDEQEIKAAEKELKLGIAQDIESSLLDAKMAKLQFKFGEMERIYQEALQLDSTHFEVLYEYAELLGKENRINECVAFAQRALVVANTDKDKADTYHMIGAMAWLNNDFDQSMEAINQSLRFNRRLEADIEHGYPQGLVNNYSGVGLAHFQRFEREPCLRYLDSALLVLHQANPVDSLKWWDDLAFLYNNLGAAHLQFGNFMLADSLLRKSLVIRQMLSNKEKSIRHYADIGLLHSNLGVLQLYRLNYPVSDSLFGKGQYYYELLLKDSLLRVEPDYANLLHNRALLFQKMNKARQAEENLHKALKIFRRWAANNPAAFQDDEIKVGSKLAGQLWQRGAYTEARQLIRQAEEGARQLSTRSQSRLAQRQFADVLDNLADINLELNEFSNAEQQYLQVLEIYKGLYDFNPLDFAGELADSHQALCLFYLSTNKLADATKHIKRAIELKKEKQLNVPASGRSSLSLLESEVILSKIYSKQNEFDQAEQSYQTYLDSLHGYERRNPGSYTDDLANVYMELGGLYRIYGYDEKSLVALTKSLDFMQSLANKLPAVYNTQLADIHLQLGYVYQGLNEFSAARKQIVAALKIYRQRLAKSPELNSSQWAVANANMALGNYYLHKYELDSAAVILDESIAHLQSLSDANSAVYSGTLADAYGLRGNLAFEARKKNEAKEYLSEAIRIYRLHPPVSEIGRSQLAQCYSNISAVLLELGDHQQGLHYVDSSLMINKQLAVKNPQAYEPYMILTYNNRGIMYQKLNEHQKAEEAYLEAIRLGEKYYESYPDLVAQNLSRAYWNYGVWQWQMSKGQRGSDLLERGIAIDKALAHKDVLSFYHQYKARCLQLADSLNTTGRPEQAAAIFDEMVEFWKEQYKQKKTRSYGEELMLTYGNQLDFLVSNQLDSALIKRSGRAQLAFLEEFIKEEGGNTSVSWYQLSKVLVLMANFEETETGLANIGRAIKLKEQVVALEPDNLSIQQDLAILYADQADNLLRIKNDRSAASALLSQSNATLLAIENRQANDALTFKRAQNHHLLAQLNAAPDSIDHHMGQAIALLEGIYANNANNKDLDLELSTSYLDYGKYLLEQRDSIQKGADLYLKAIPLLQRLRAQPNDKAAFSLAETYFTLSKISNVPQEVEELSAAAIEILEDLYQRYPNELEISTALTTVYNEQAGYLINTRDPAKQAKAKALFQKSIPIMDRLIAHERRPDWLNALANVYEILGQTTDTALQAIEYKTLEIGLREELYQAFSGNAQLLTALSQAYLNMCWHQLLAGQHGEAESYLSKGKTLDDSFLWVHTMPPLLMLLQNRFEEAKAYYQQYKDTQYQGQSYKATFLEDLKMLVSQGVSHPDIEKIKALLER